MIAPGIATRLALVEAALDPLYARGWTVDAINADLEVHGLPIIGRAINNPDAYPVVHHLGELAHHLTPTRRKP